MCSLTQLLLGFRGYHLCFSPVYCLATSHSAEVDSSSARCLLLESPRVRLRHLSLFLLTTLVNKLIQSQSLSIIALCWWLLSSEIHPRFIYLAANLTFPFDYHPVNLSKAELTFSTINIIALHCFPPEIRHRRFILSFSATPYSNLVHFSLLSM